MRFKRFDTAKPFVTLGLVVIAWLLLPVAVKSFTRASFFELTAPVTVAASYARDLKEYWSLRSHSKHDLIQAGTDLARINASYELAVHRNSELQAEIARLESLLKVPSFPEYRYEHARVARRDFNGWWQTIVIRKGRNYGIPVDAPVVFSGGVVGKVREVHLNTSVVELISSPGLRLAAVIEEDARKRALTYQGGVNSTLGPAMGVVENAPLDIPQRPGMPPKRLVTSGLGGVFPPGLTLGHVTKLELGSDGLFQAGEVQLDERLGSLTEVTVLVPLNPE